jgi:hypothetical protein
MGNENKKYNISFKAAYNNLPRGIYLDVNRELREQLKWSQSLLYMRLSGARTIKDAEVPIIRMIFEKHGINVFE